MNDVRSPSIESHRDLIVWRKSMDLAVAAYRLTAEGYGRESAGAYAQQLRVAQGSLKEFETHVELAHRIGMIQTSPLSSILGISEEIGKMLRSLIRAVER